VVVVVVVVSAQSQHTPAVSMEAQLPSLPPSRTTPPPPTDQGAALQASHPTKIKIQNIMSTWAWPSGGTWCSAEGERLWEWR
jgi:hypothetical protein